AGLRGLAPPVRPGDPGVQRLIHRLEYGRSLIGRITGLRAAEFTHQGGRPEPGRALAHRVEVRGVLSVARLADQEDPGERRLVVEVCIKDIPSADRPDIR